MDMDSKQAVPEKKVLKKNKLITKLKQVKHIEIIIALVLTAILLLVYAFFSANKSTVQKASVGEDDINLKIAKILSQIKGVGESTVLITYKSGKTVEIAMETTKETIVKPDGTTEVIKETSNPVIINKNGENSPLVLKENAAEIEGIVVVAEGANDPKIKFEITSAISTLLNIDSFKIKIFTKK